MILKFETQTVKCRKCESEKLAPPKSPTKRKKQNQSMLRATRLVTASKRGFATVVDASPGFKVAAVDNGQPTSSVTVLLKAGSRYESKPGVAHTLSNFAFKVRLPLTTQQVRLVPPGAVVQSV